MIKIDLANIGTQTTELNPAQVLRQAGAAQSKGAGQSNQDVLEILYPDMAVGWRFALHQPL